MTEIYIVAAIALMATGAGIAILLLFAVAIHREDKAYSLSAVNPGRFKSGVRTIVSAYAHPSVPKLRSHR